MVDERPLGDLPLPFLLTPRRSGLDLPSWAAKNRERLSQLLLKYGSLLFRGFGTYKPEDLNQFIRAVSGEPLAYTERSSPRHAVHGNLYSSTDHPADQHIFLHNENSYQHVWPMKVFFQCVTPPGSGGETPLADCRRILKRIDPEVVSRFSQAGFRIVRNFTPGIGLPWQTVFSTDEPAVVDAYCAEKGIETIWREDGRLKTVTVRPHVALPHPVSGEKVWFNHGAFFHHTTLPQSIRDVLLADLPESDYPTNTYYGDGSTIDEATMDHVRAAYLAEKVAFPYERGDLLMVDNMLCAHGRHPFTGDRKIVVGMAEPMSLEKMSS